MAIITESTDLPDFFNDMTPLREADVFNGTTFEQFDKDWIPVQLFADRSYVVEFRQDYGQAFVSVLDSSGTELSGPEGTFPDGVQTVVTVPTDGVYYIETSGSRFKTGETSGDYSITLRSEIGDNANTKESLPLDVTSSPVATFNGVFDHAKDTDYIAVELETGYTYQVFNVTNDRNTTFGIRDSEDNDVSRDYANDSRGFTVDEAGTYFLYVTNDINRPRPNDVNDQYRLTIEVEPNANQNTAYSLRPGETIAEKYDGFGDIDWFGVTMKQGVSYLVVNEAGKIQDLDFVEADGDRVAETSVAFGRGNYQAVTPEQSGDYFIKVIPNGAYRISLMSEVAGDVSTASRLPFGATESSSFDFYRDEDVFAFDVIEGATYKAVGTLNEASALSIQLTAIDMDGIESRGSLDSDRAEVTFTAPATGTMYLKATGSGTYGTSDDYDLFLTRESFGDNLISGTSDNDRLLNTAGNDAFDGKSGRDTVVYDDPSTAYTVAIRPDGDITVLDRRGNDFDVLANIEEIVFSDRSFDLDNFSNAAKLGETDMIELAKVYAAYFNRAPDAIGLAFWADKRAEGLSIEETAEYFFDQDETRALYPDPDDTATFVTQVYANVLGRAPDAAGFDFWTNQLSLGNFTQGQFVLEIIRGAQADDILYLDNKANLGVNFSAIDGMSHLGDANDVFTAFGGSEVADVAAALQASEGHLEDAINPDSGDFLFQFSGAIDDPFMFV
ncbi:DUF4214 domain-containing protein [Marivita sp. S2033]|uniref:DUF4214 domain-containing protein n=1 Tax=Marivita sp. S2033 TaxID=3373187 RepID=UPI003982404C